MRGPVPLVYLSCASEDLDEARPFIVALEARLRRRRIDLHVRADHPQPTSESGTSAGRLRTARALVSLVSPHYFADRWCAAEWWVFRRRLHGLDHDGALRVIGIPWTTNGGVSRACERAQLPLVSDDDGAEGWSELSPATRDERLDDIADELAETCTTPAARERFEWDGRLEGRDGFEEGGALPRPRGTLRAYLEGRELAVGAFEGAVFLDARWPERASDIDRDLAWAVHVELRSRVATQPLPTHSGEERAALESLSALFAFVRDQLLHRGADAGRVGLLAQWMVNHLVRPFTAYWHGAAGRGGLEHADDTGAFRSDLEALQASLCTFCDLFGFVAMGDVAYAPHRLRADRGVTPRPSASWATREVAPQGDWRELLDERESAVISTRRVQLGLERRGWEAGLALSGGGIRSATFCMGVLQGLADAGVYRDVDLLSTVSGGGYTGALLSSGPVASAGETSEGGLDAERDGPLRTGPNGAEPAVVQRVRGQSRYIVAGGGAVLFRAGARIGLGMLCSVAMIGCLVLGGAGFAIFARELVRMGSALAGVPSLSSVGAVAAALYALAVVLEPRRRQRDAFIAVHWVALVLVALVGFAGLVHGLAWLFDVAATAVGRDVSLASLGRAELWAVALSPALSAAGHILQRRRVGGGRWARWLLMASPLVAYVVAVALVLGALGAEPLATISSALAPRWEWAVGIGLATLVLLLVHDVNRLSAHAHYADALRRTFCGSSARRALHERDPERPVHLVNVTANLPSSRHATLRGCRPAVLSSCVSMYPIQGEPSAGSEDAVVGGGPFAAARAETAKSQREDTFADMDLGTAIAISGAAVSSRMGVVGPAGAAPWLTLLNLRMGYWIPNPVRTVRRRADARYLFRELAGVAHERLDRLDLSDGGHFENLAIYELIRRRCAYIVAIDGEADPALHLGGLHRLVHLARVDFGADIRIDTSSVRLDEDGVVARHFALGEIRYRDGAVGRLLYVKLSVSGDEPGYVHAYRRANPTFPHQSTADQLFDEAQFEAYRALGEHVGRALFRTEIVGSELAARAEARFGGGQGPRVEMARWFEAMEDRLLYRTAFPRPRRA